MADNRNLVQLLFLVEQMVAPHLKECATMLTQLDKLANELADDGPEVNASFLRQCLETTAQSIRVTIRLVRVAVWLCVILLGISVPLLAAALTLLTGR